MSFPYQRMRNRALIERRRAQSAGLPAWADELVGQMLGRAGAAREAAVVRGDGAYQRACREVVAARDVLRAYLSSVGGEYAAAVA